MNTANTVTAPAVARYRLITSSPSDSDVIVGGRVRTNTDGVFEYLPGTPRRPPPTFSDLPASWQERLNRAYAVLEVAQ